MTVANQKSLREEVSCIKMAPILWHCIRLHLRTKRAICLDFSQGQLPPALILASYGLEQPILHHSFNDHCNVIHSTSHRGFFHTQEYKMCIELADRNTRIKKNRQHESNLLRSAILVFVVVTCKKARFFQTHRKKFFFRRAFILERIRIW